MNSNGQIKNWKRKTRFNGIRVDKTTREGREEREREREKRREKELEENNLAAIPFRVLAVADYVQSQF